jgi:hypothetical protein
MKNFLNCKPLLRFTLISLNHSRSVLPLKGKLCFFFYLYISASIKKPNRHIVWLGKDDPSCTPITFRLNEFLFSCLNLYVSLSSTDQQTFPTAIINIPNIPSVYVFEACARATTESLNQVERETWGGGASGWIFLYINPFSER